MRYGSATRRGPTSSLVTSSCPLPLYDRVVEVDERVGATARSSTPLDDERHALPSAAFATRHRALAIVLMHGWRWTAHEATLAEIARETRLHSGLGEPRGRAADQADRPRRHHGGRRLSVAGAAPLCRPGRGGPAGRRRPPFHAVERRARRSRGVPRQGCDPVRTGRRHRRHGRGERAARRRPG